MKAVGSGGGGKLHDAIRQDDLSNLEYVLTTNPDKDAKNKEGLTALDYAISIGSYHLAKIILNDNYEIELELGAKPNKRRKPTNVNIQDTQGLTTLHRILSYREPSKELFDKLLNYRPFVRKKINETESVVTYNDKMKINLNIQDKNGDTPLHIAIQRNDGNDFAISLIDSGAKLDIQNKDGNTPLFEAVARSKKEVVEALIAKGANLDIQNEYGETPLHLAAKNGKAEMVNSLVKAGAKLDIQDKDGNTPLMLLLQYGASNDKKSKLKNELLNKMLDAIPESERRAVLNIRNKKGETIYTLGDENEVGASTIRQTLAQKANPYLAHRKIDKVEEQIISKRREIKNDAYGMSEYLGADQKKEKLAKIQKDTDSFDKELKEARNKLGEEIRRKRWDEFFTSGKISSDNIHDLKTIQQTIDRARVDMKTEINSTLKNKKIKERIK